MKKFLPYILIFIIAVGLFVPTRAAHAQLFSSLGTAAAAVASSAAAATVSATIKAGLTYMFVQILGMMSYIVGLSGLFLNFVLKFTISDLQANISGLTGINIAWKVIKDLMNMVFIFMLIYEGIRLIIGQGSSQQIRKFIVGIVLSALLINFSLFFTKVMIDASNIVTIGFYNSILGDKAAQAGYGLSDPIMTNLGITSIFSTSAPADFAAGKDLSGVLIMGFGSSLIILIAAFVFFAISILFVIRYITLIILLMLSPIAYMGLALPQINNYSREWWDSFRGQLLFAPIYMIMTWVILILMSSPGFVAVKDFTKIINNSGNPSFQDMGLLLNFTLVVGLLIASLVIAKSTASRGSKLIGQATGKLSAFAGGTIIGGTARLGRNTVGRAGNAVANSEGLKDTAVNGNIFTRNMAQFALNRGNRAATATFDARATNAVSGLSKTTGFNFGKVEAKKENFRAQADERDKAELKRMEQYKTTDLAKQEAENRLKKEGNNLAESERTLKNLKASLDSEEKGTREWFRIEAEIARAEKEVADKEKLIALAGGTKKEKGGVIKDAAGNIMEREIKSTYDQRLEAQASRIENASPLRRYAANTFGTVTNVAGISSVPRTKRDRKDLARKVRALAKGKSAKDKAVEALRDVAKGDDSFKLTDDEETPAAPAAPTPAPETPPTAGGTT